MPSFDDRRLTLPKGGSDIRLQVSAGVAAMRRKPAADAEQVSQILHGETVSLHHEEGEFGLVQNEADRYVGWVLMEALSAPVLGPTHRVSAPRLHAYAEPSIKAAPNFVLGVGAQLTCTGEKEGRYVRCERAGWVLESLLRPIGKLDKDPASVAEKFLTTPYLWGGRDCLGIDCSGLIQLAFGACGIACPRDSDMQRAWMGQEIDNWSKAGSLERNDLVFWDGHVGIMLDAERLLHANAYHMAVAAEPLGLAIDRISNQYGEPVGARRVDILSMKGVKPDWLTPR